MKNLFKLLLFYLFKKTINIEIYDRISEYIVSNIEVSLRSEDTEKIVITLMDKDSYKIPESWKNLIKS